MEHGDERVEALLRQFQPRAPRALPFASDRPHVTRWRGRGSVARFGGWAGVAAAAAAAVFAANLRFMPMARLTPDAVVGPGLTVHDMRGLLDADAATLDQALLDASREVLPDVEAPDSVFGQLAQP
jgi:hypothetical protein